MAQIAMIAGLGMMCLSSSVGSALMMGGGEEDDGAGGVDDTYTPQPQFSVIPQRLCEVHLPFGQEKPSVWGMVVDV